MTDREQCSKRGCEAAAVVVIKVYTEDKPSFMAFCNAHLFVASAVLKELGHKQNPIPDHMPDQPSGPNWSRDEQVLRSMQHATRELKDITSPPAQISLREHYAGLAMQGMLSGAPSMTDEEIAQASVALADALLKELKK